MERKLYRIEGGNSIVGGVASGLSEYFNIDVAIIRVIFVLGFFTPLPSIIAYGLLWIALPSKFGGSSFATATKASNDTNQTPFTTMTNKSNSSQLGGIILVILGGIFLADEFIPWFDFDKLWPLILVGAGLWMLTKDKGNNNPSSPGPSDSSASASHTDTTESYYNPDASTEKPEGL